MATKNIVPRITNEGKLGKPDKRWAQGNFSTGSFGLISGSLIPDAKESHDLGTAARPWKEIFVSTSSLNFVNPANDSVIQTLAATEDGFDFGGADVSGSTISGSKLHVTGDAFIGGNLTLGDANTDSIEITADLTSDLIPNASDSFNLGSETQRWNDLFLSGSISASGGPVDIDSATTVAINSTTTTTIEATTTLSAKGNGGASFGDDTGTWEFDGSGAVTETGMTSFSLTPSSTVDIDAGGALTLDGSSITIGGDSDVAFDIDTSTLDIDSSDAVTIDSTAGISIDAAAASNLSTSGGLLTLSGADGVSLSGAVTASTHISSSGNLSATGNLDIDGTGNIQGVVTLQDELSVSGAITGSAISGSTGAFTSINVDGGTIDGITSLTAAGNLDIGSHDLRAATITADGLTDGRVVFAGSNGVLSDDSDLSFSGDTLTATKIGAFEAAGAIDFSDENMTNVNIDSGAIDAVTLGTNSAVTEAQIDDININGSTIKDFGTLSGSSAATISVGGNVTAGGGTLGDIKVGVTADGEIDSTGAITIDGGTGVTIQEDGTDVIAIDTNQDVLFSRTGGSSSDPDVEFDGYTKFDGISEFTGDVTSSANISGSNSGVLTFGNATINNASIGSLSAALDANNQNITNIDIDSGTIDGTDVTVGSGKTLDVSGGTLTLANDQISGDKINGGTIGSVTISQLAGALDANNQNITNIDIDSGAIDGVTLGTNSAITEAQIDSINIDGTTIKDFATLSGSSAATISVGGTISANQLGTDDDPVTAFINNGEIDGTVIGGESAAAATFTTINASGDIRTEGNVIAENYIVSSSVTHMTQSFSEGSTIFGDTINDSHQFTGSVEITGSFVVNPHGSNLITGSKLTIDSAGGYSGSSTSIGSFGKVNVANDTIKLGVDAVREISSDGELVIDGATGVKVQEGGTDIIAIDTNQDVLFSRTGGSTSDPDVEFDGYVRFDGSVEVDSGINVDGNITVDGNLTGDHGSNNLEITSTNAAVLIEGITFDGNDVTIPGNLTVQGEQTAASNAELVVSSSTITVASGSTASADLDGAGLNFGDDGTTANLRYVHSGTQITSSVPFAAPSATFDGGVDIDNFNIDGTEIALSSGDLTLNVAGDVNIDADGGDFTLTDNSVPLATINANLISGSHAADLQVGGNVSASNAIFTGRVDINGVVDIDGTVDVDNDTFSVDSSGAVSIDAGAGSNFTTSDGTLTIEAGGADDKLVLKGDHTGGTAIHIDGNENANSIIDIDGGSIDIDAAASTTIDSAVTSSITSPRIDLHGTVLEMSASSFTTITGNSSVTIGTGGAGDINLNATGDVNIPTDVGVTFGDDGEKIEGDGTDLTIASSGKLNLNATSDVHVPKNVGIVFDDNGSEKIESNDTNLTINSGADIDLTATGDVNIPAQVGLTFGADTEKIEVDDSNNMSIIANGDITLHPGGNNVLPGGDNEDDLGAADTRWRNIFTADMHFSNMGTEGNDVDGSTGNWTLQEGENDIFMINNNTGKKYKIGLIEVE